MLFDSQAFLLFQIEPAAQGFDLGKANAVALHESVASLVSVKFCSKIRCILKNVPGKACAALKVDFEDSVEFVPGGK